MAEQTAEKKAEKYLFLAGSSRQSSVNKSLAIAACEIASSLGVDAEFVDLADYEMPIYNGDYEAAHSLPDAAIRLKEKFIGCRGFLIASPEYNGSFSSVLKNTIDWMSRKHTDDEPGMQAYRGKTAAVVAASPGGLGGLRGLVPLRMLLGNIGVTVVPDQLAVGSIHQKLTDGIVTDEETLTALKGVVSALISTGTTANKQ